MIGGNVNRGSRSLRRCSKHEEKNPCAVSSRGDSLHYSPSRECLAQVEKLHSRPTSTHGLWAGEVDAGRDGGTRGPLPVILLSRKSLDDSAHGVEDGKSG